MRARVKYEISMLYQPAQFVGDPLPRAVGCTGLDPVHDSRKSMHERVPGETEESLVWRLERVAQTMVVAAGRRLQAQFPSATISALRLEIESDGRVKSKKLLALG